MLNLNDKGAIRACRDVLSEFYRCYRRDYIRFFFQRQPVVIAKAYAEPLGRAGIVKTTKAGMRPLVRIFPLKGRFIATDYLVPRKTDNVFAIQIDESAHFAQNLNVEHGDVVLDLFTGSGIYPIFCADHAKEIYAVDISSKALTYARFNAVLNHVEQKMTFLQGNMFAPVSGRRFDLITASPPCVPTPPTRRVEALFADSGIDGFKYPREFLDQVTGYLATGGRIQMYLGVVGTRERSFIEEYLVEAFRCQRVRIVLSALHNRPIRLETLIGKKFTDPHAFRFRVSAERLLNWRSRLRGEGFTHFYYYLASIQSANIFEVVKEKPARGIKKDFYMISDLGLYPTTKISQLLREYCD